MIGGRLSVVRMQIDDGNVFDQSAGPPSSQFARKRESLYNLSAVPSRCTSSAASMSQPVDCVNRVSLFLDEEGTLHARQTRGPCYGMILLEKHATHVRWKEERRRVQARKPRDDPVSSFCCLPTFLLLRERYFCFEQICGAS